MRKAAQPSDTSGPSLASPPAPAAKVPAFQRIKAHILEQVHSGVWKEGEAIPSEEALARSFSVSRMTVNRALRELSDDQILQRVQGSGTFVAQQKYQATLVDIRNIAEEIKARGHQHRSELHRLERCRAGELLAPAFRLEPAQALFHSVVVHFENDLPIQVEDRYVNPQVAPGYLELDFHTHTPNAYLMKIAPLQGVKFSIEARTPPEEVGEMLQMAAGEVCLVLKRTTLSQARVASVATLWHPASRYQFTGSF